jgi:hypothetical protein
MKENYSENKPVTFRGGLFTRISTIIGLVQFLCQLIEVKNKRQSEVNLSLQTCVSAPPIHMNSICCYVFMNWLACYWVRCVVNKEIFYKLMVSWFVKVHLSSDDEDDDGLKKGDNCSSNTRGATYVAGGARRGDDSKETDPLLPGSENTSAGVPTPVVTPGQYHMVVINYRPIGTGLDPHLHRQRLSTWVTEFLRERW